MSQRRSSTNGKSGAVGFTLFEVVVSIAILSIGLLGVAALVSSELAVGNQAKYMNMANFLASEKLDSLNKWPASDPNVAPGGSLTLTGAAGSACAANDDYCDQVDISETSNGNYETQTQIENNVAVTSTIVHTSAGCVDTPTNCKVAAPSGADSTFIRRWQITADPNVTSAGGTATTITGARRITVVVSLVSKTNQPVNFQMSMVRP